MTDALSPEEQLRQNVKELIDLHGLNQVKFAALMGRSQSWVSKVLSGGIRWKMEDLEGLSRVFGRSPSELLRPGIGRHDRRKLPDRRIAERRGQHDPPPDRARELAEAAARLKSPPRPPGGRFLVPVYDAEPQRERPLPNDHAD